MRFSLDGLSDEKDTYVPSKENQKKLKVNQKK